MLKKSFILLTFCLQILFCHSQGGWKKQYFLQNSLTSSSGNIIETPNQNYISIGITYDTLNGNGFNRLTILGIDNNGNIQWRKDYGKYKFEYLNTITHNAVIQDTGGFHLTICARDSTNKHLSALIKFNYNGDTLWQKKYYSNILGTSLYLNGIHKSVDGGFLMCGEYANNQSEPGLIIKTDFDGNELWRSIVNKPAPNVSRCYSILQDSTTKKIYTVGYQYIGNSTSWSIFGSLLILDSLGNKINQLSLNNAGAGFICLIQLKDNNFLTGGSTFEQQIGPTAKYKSSLIKFDISGNIIWSEKYDIISPYNNMDFFYELPNNEILTLGSLDTMQNYLTQPVIKLRLAKVDQNGNLVWRRYIGSSFNNYHSEGPFSFRRTSDGGSIIASGFFFMQSPRPYSIIKIDSLGCDTIAAYCQTIVSVSELYNTTGISFEMYPNPASEKVSFSISASGDSDFEIKISDLRGNYIKQFVFDKTQVIELDTKGLSEGVYLVTIFSEGKAMESRKLIILR